MDPLIAKGVNLKTLEDITPLHVATIHAQQIHDRVIKKARSKKIDIGEPSL